MAFSQQDKVAIILRMSQSKKDDQDFIQGRLSALSDSDFQSMADRYGGIDSVRKYVQGDGGLRNAHTQFAAAVLGEQPDLSGGGAPAPAPTPPTPAPDPPPPPPVLTPEPEEPMDTGMEGIDDNAGPTYGGTVAGPPTVTTNPLLQAMQTLQDAGITDTGVLNDALAGNDPLTQMFLQDPVSVYQQVTAPKTVEEAYSQGGFQGMVDFASKQPEAPFSQEEAEAAYADQGMQGFIDLAQGKYQPTVAEPPGQSWTPSDLLNALDSMSPEDRQFMNQMLERSGGDTGLVESFMQDPQGFVEGAKTNPIFADILPPAPPPPPAVLEDQPGPVQGPAGPPVDQPPPGDGGGPPAPPPYQFSDAFRRHYNGLDSWQRMYIDNLMLQGKMSFEMEDLIKNDPNTFWYNAGHEGTVNMIDNPQPSTPPGEGQPPPEPFQPTGIDLGGPPVDEGSITEPIATGESAFPDAVFQPRGEGTVDMPTQTVTDPVTGETTEEALAIGGDSVPTGLPQDDPTAAYDPYASSNPAEGDPRNDNPFGGGPGSGVQMSDPRPLWDPEPVIPTGQEGTTRDDLGARPPSSPDFFADPDFMENLWHGYTGDRTEGAFSQPGFGNTLGQPVEGQPDYALTSAFQPHYDDMVRSVLRSMERTPGELTGIIDDMNDGWTNVMPNNPPPGAFNPDGSLTQVGLQWLTEEAEIAANNALGQDPRMAGGPPAGRPAGQQPDDPRLPQPPEVFDFAQWGNEALGQIQDALSRATDPDEITALVQSWLMLQNLPSQKWFQETYPDLYGTGVDIFNTGQNWLTEPYTLPDAPPVMDYGADEFYEGGQAAKDWNQYLIDSIAALGIPLENLRDVTHQAGSYVEGRDPSDLTNPYRADVKYEYDKAQEGLKERLAARGILNSSMADDAYADLLGQYTRGLGHADLAFYQGLGPERRADFEMVAGLLSDLFGQQVTGSQLALSQMGTLGGAVGQGEGFDLTRSQGWLDRTGMQDQSWQTAFQNAMALMQLNEQIPGNRFQVAQQPWMSLLSALSGTNVAPGTVSPPTFYPPQPGGWEQFGGFLGDTVGNVAGALPWGSWFGGGK